VRSYTSEIASIAHEKDAKEAATNCEEEILTVLHERLVSPVDVEITCSYDNW
jgi:hypothetical protein